MLNLKSFLNKCSKESSPIGDLAREMLSDSAIPDSPEDKEFFDYMENKNKSRKAEEALKEFKASYGKWKNN